MKPITRRVWLGSVTGAAAAIAARSAFAQRGQSGPDAMELAAEYVRIAEASRVERGLWGRIGGSEAERDAAYAFARQIAPYVDDIATETFTFNAHRPESWTLRIQGGGRLQTAMPAPFDARFPDGRVAAPVRAIQSERDWEGVEGRWVYVAMPGIGENIVRDNLLYQRAVSAGAAGLLFSLPEALGTQRWQAVLPVDKPYAVHDERYPDGNRPIPCYCIDAIDGAEVAAAVASGNDIVSLIQYVEETELEAKNAVGYLAGTGDQHVLLTAHLDSFFQGANDDASGLATLALVAHRLSELPKESRAAHFWIVACAAHHDRGEGMRAFVNEDPDRFSRIDGCIAIEHVDAQRGPEGEEAGWDGNLNDQRVAFAGPEGWPEIEAVLEQAAIETGLMTVAPPVRKACISDLHVVCETKKTFCLIQAPPYYHTDHDTLDKITKEGIVNAAEFHVRILAAIRAVNPA
jgi:hypothetical protein